MVHRDLKSLNLLVDKHWTVKVGGNKEEEIERKRAKEEERSEEIWKKLERERRPPAMTSSLLMLILFLLFARIDFGSSRFTYRNNGQLLTTLGRMRGTFTYTPPELFEGEVIERKTS